MASAFPLSLLNWSARAVRKTCIDITLPYEIRKLREAEIPTCLREKVLGYIEKLELTLGNAPCTREIPHMLGTESVSAHEISPNCTYRLNIMTTELKTSEDVWIFSLIEDPYGVDAKCTVHDAFALSPLLAIESRGENHISPDPEHVIELKGAANYVLFRIRPYVKLNNCTFCDSVWLRVVFKKHGKSIDSFDVDEYQKCVPLLLSNNTPYHKIMYSSGLH